MGRHAPKWMLLLGSTLPRAAIRALEWMGEPHVSGAMESYVSFCRRATGKIYALFSTFSRLDVPGDQS